MFFPQVKEQRNSLVSHHERIRLEKEKEQRASELDECTTDSSTQVLESMYRNCPSISGTSV